MYAATGGRRSDGVKDSCLVPTVSSLFHRGKDTDITNDTRGNIYSTDPFKKKKVSFDQDILLIKMSLFFFLKNNPSCQRCDLTGGIPESEAWERAGGWNSCDWGLLAVSL